MKITPLVKAVGIVITFLIVSSILMGKQIQKDLDLEKASDSTPATAPWLRGQPPVHYYGSGDTQISSGTRSDSPIQTMQDFGDLQDPTCGSSDCMKVVEQHNIERETKRLYGDR
jgi:hypothetical protein